jgi:hypothetical protein
MDIFNIIDLENEKTIGFIEIDSDVADGSLMAEIIRNTPDKLKEKTIRFELSSSEEERSFEPFTLEYIAPSDDDII